MPAPAPTAPPPTLTEQQLNALRASLDALGRLTYATASVLRAGPHAPHANGGTCAEAVALAVVEYVALLEVCGLEDHLSEEFRQSPAPLHTLQALAARRPEALPPDFKPEDYL